VNNATVRLDTDRLIKDMFESGMPEAKAYVLTRLLVDVHVPGFSREIAHQDLVRAATRPKRRPNSSKDPCSARQCRRRTVTEQGSCRDH
jgi:hypothetical protein